MANLKALLPVVTVPPITAIVIGSSQTITSTGTYFIDGAFDITMPAIGDFSKADIIELIPKEGFTSKAIGDTATDILIDGGLTTNEVIFNKARVAKFIHDGSKWEVKV